MLLFREGTALIGDTICLYQQRNLKFCGELFSSVTPTITCVSVHGGSPSCLVSC